jgi:hypothetical protein
MSLNKLEEKITSLEDKVNENHIETIKAIHMLDRKLAEYDQNTKIIKWIAPPGAIMAVFAFFKDWFKN